MFDIDTNKLDNTAEFEVLDELGKPSDAFITMFSPDSEEFQAVKTAQRQRIMAAMQDGTRISADQSAMDVETIEFLVGVTADWRGFTASGEPFPFNHENCRKLYRGAPFVKNQCDEFLSIRRNFKKG